MGANKNRMTAFDKMQSDFDTIHSKRMNEIMVTSTDEEFSVLFFKLAEYTHAKLTRREVIQEEKEQEIRIVHVFKDEGTSEELKEGLVKP